MSATKGCGQAPSCENHGVMVPDDEAGHNWHCAVCSCRYPAPEPSATTDPQRSSLGPLIDIIEAEMNQLRAALATERQQHAQQQSSADMTTAQLRGWVDFFSGQPRDMPYNGSEVFAAKNSQMNVAWCLGYDLASESILYTAMVGRADRATARLQGAASEIEVLRAQLATAQQTIKAEMAVSNRLRVSWNEDVGEARRERDAALEQVKELEGRIASALL